jgi:hypothetical protein
VPQREVGVPVDQRRQRGGGVGGGGDPRPADGEQLEADGDQHLGEHGVLGGEVLVDRGARDAAGGAEVGDRHAVEATGGEELGRGSEDLLSAAGRLAGHEVKVSAR